MRPLGRSLALLPLHAAVAATVCWPLPIRLGGALPGEVGPGLVRSVLHWRALVAGGAAELVQSGSVQQPFGVDLLARDGLPWATGLAAASGLEPALGLGVATLVAATVAGLAASWLVASRGHGWGGMVLAGMAWPCAAAAGELLVTGDLGRLGVLAVLPVACGASLRAVEAGSVTWGLLAGLTAALVGLSWPTAGLAVAVVGLLAVGMAAGGARIAEVWRAAAGGLAGALSVGLVPGSWWSAHGWLRPGASGEAVSTEAGLVHGVQIAAEASLGATAGAAWWPAGGLVLLGLVGLSAGIWRGRRREALLWGLVALALGVLALGPQLGPVSGPGGVLLALPGRLWAPAELAVGIELAFLVLAAGALLWLPAGLQPLGGVVVGAGLVVLTVVGRGEVPTTPWPPRGGGFLEVDGPVVWLPVPGGPEDPDGRGLLDAAWEDVHLVSPIAPSGQDWGEDPVAAHLSRRWGPLETLARLGDEAAPENFSSEALGLLGQTGAVALVVDHVALREGGERGARILSRLGPVLGPPVVGMRYQVVPLELPARAPVRAGP